MFEHKVKLTKSEQGVMELFWNENKPLTSVELFELSKDQPWNGNYLHILLKSLLKKNMLEVCGITQYGKQYARNFVPSITKEAYAAKVALSIGIDESAIGKVAVELAKRTSGDKELISQLEEIIKELKKEEKK